MSCESDCQVTETSQRLHLILNARSVARSTKIQIISFSLKHLVLPAYRWSAEVESHKHFKPVLITFLDNLKSKNVVDKGRWIKPAWKVFSQYPEGKSNIISYTSLCRPTWRLIYCIIWIFEGSWNSRRQLINISSYSFIIIISWTAFAKVLNYFPDFVLLL